MRTLAVWLPAFCVVALSSVLLSVSRADKVEAAKPNKEFYDLTKDPYQMTSLHNSHKKPYPAQRAALAALLAKLKTCAGATCRGFEDE